jgi:hypothetical protein
VQKRVFKARKGLELAALLDQPALEDGIAPHLDLIVGRGEFKAHADSLRRTLYGLVAGKGTWLACPSGMVTDKDLYAETLCGLMDYYGERQLARILNVTVVNLYRWSSGKSRPPSEIFVRIISLSNAAERSEP